MSGTLKDPRKAFSDALMEIGKENPRVLAVSCDSASGSGMSDFLKTYPERYVEVGISEQNAIDVSAGLAERGFIPVISAIAPFISMRCYEQVRNDVGYSKMNVKVIGSSSGLSHSTLGSSHQAVEDMCLMRSIPNMVILNPGDYYEVQMSLKKAVEYDGPVYIRMPRHAAEDVAPAEKRNFEIGKAEVLSRGSDVTLIATGTLVNEAQKAAEALKARGISAGVVNMCTVKPLDMDAVLSSYKNSRLLVTIEEHSVVGGLGGAVAEAIAPLKGGAPLQILGIAEGAVNVGPYRELLESYSLTGEKLADSVYQFYQKI